MVVDAQEVIGGVSEAKKGVEGDIGRAVLAFGSVQSDF